MKKFLMLLASGGLFLFTTIGIADEHEGEADEANVATPIEMYACKYNKGKGPADLDAAIKKFNAWGDKQGINDYSAWTLAPYYFGPEQEFDVLWLGGSKKAKSLGRVQDAWLATGAREQEGFNEVMACDTHAAYSALLMKAPPERARPSNVVISFSDCNTADGVTFGELYVPLIEWGKYMSEHGSTAGHWAFFPTYGGGGDEFDFKFIESFQNLEELGADWDHLNETGWEKVEELFAGKLRCDSSRSYLATSRRMAKTDDE